MLTCAAPSQQRIWRLASTQKQMSALTLILLFFILKHITRDFLLLALIDHQDQLIDLQDMLDLLHHFINNSNSCHLLETCLVFSPWLTWPIFLQHPLLCPCSEDLV